MSYEEKWKALANMLIELQKRGEKTPLQVMNNLRSAKTIVQVLKADPTHIESKARIEEYLRIVEAYVILTAEKLEIKTVEQWLNRIKDTKTLETDEENHIRVIPGVSKDTKWIRIKVSEDTPPKVVEQFVKKSKLSCKNQEEDHIIVYGDEKGIKSFVKRMAEQFRNKRDT